MSEKQFKNLRSWIIAAGTTLAGIFMWVGVEATNIKNNSSKSSENRTKIQDLQIQIYESNLAHSKEMVEFYKQAITQEDLNNLKVDITKDIADFKTDVISKFDSDFNYINEKVIWANEFKECNKDAYKNRESPKPFK